MTREQIIARLVEAFDGDRTHVPPDDAGRSCTQVFPDADGLYSVGVLTYGEIAGALAADPDRHAYLSTSCLHGKHGYCASPVGVSASGETWAKTPGTCKWCSAVCRCDCHLDPEQQGESQ